MDSIKLRVKEILKEKGITQKDFAAQIGMTEVGLSKSINEEGNPPLKKIAEMASILQVPISELFEQPKENVIICPKCGTKLEVKEKE